MFSRTSAARQSTAHEAWGLVLELWQRHSNLFEDVAAAHGLAPGHVHLLRELDPERAAPMKDIALGLGCDASNVTGLVDRMEAIGLVERRAHERDRRVKLVALTPRGAKLREQVLLTTLEPPDELMRLSRSDQRALRTVLRRALGYVGD